MELDKSAESISKRLDDQLKLIEIGRSLRESSGLWLLSVLAVIFLPLPLASSLLSMQTRFVDLYYLLYDFFGVIVLLGTSTVAIVVILKLLILASEKTQSRIKQRIVRLLIAWGVGFMVAVPWVLTLVSFLVGMIKDVGLGLKILGYGVAGIAAVVAITIFAAMPT